jgi:hypothetical protein
MTRLAAVTVLVRYSCSWSCCLLSSFSAGPQQKAVVLAVCIISKKRRRRRRNTSQAHPPTMNIFRILADVSHAASKITLIVAIHRNSSAEGVSLLTQLLYALVFCARYLDLFWVPPWFSWWNFLFKLFYISTSIYVVYLMMHVYPRTREKEGAWKITTWTLGACVVSAPLVTLVFNRLSFWRFFAEVGFCRP